MHQRAYSVGLFQMQVTETNLQLAESKHTHTHTHKHTHTHTRTEKKQKSKTRNRAPEVGKARDGAGPRIHETILLTFPQSLLLPACGFHEIAF